MTSIANHAFNIEDIRKMAKRRLPRGVFEFVDRGSEGERAIAGNRSAFDRIKIRARHLVDVSSRSLAADVLGRSISMPVIIAPTGVADILWYRGESALARAATEAGIPFTLSTSSTTSLEAIFELTHGTMWMQTYLWEERELSYLTIERAIAAGVKTLVITVDTPVMPNREFNARNGFVNPFRLTPRLAADICRHPSWLVSVMGRYMVNGGVPRYANYPPQMGGKITGRPVRIENASSVTWIDVAELRHRWPHKLLLKGLIRPEDAVTAEKYGVDGVVVSNHGGRNLDSAPAPIDFVRDFRAALSKRTVLIVDSGIRRGSDVVKAIALGADAVMIGKAAMYGLGAAGGEGVSHALALLYNEIDRTLGLSGVTSVAELDESMVILG